MTTTIKRILNKKQNIFQPKGKLMQGPTRQNKSRYATCIGAACIGAAHVRQTVTRLLLPMLLFFGFSLGTSAKDMPGASPTSFAVNASGAFTFNLPIVVPKGVNGMQPKLSIGFSGSTANGSMGVGWGVSGLGAITRCGQTFATNGKRLGVQHAATDRLCLNGQQLILVSGTYNKANSVYRTEIDTFTRVTAHGTSGTSINGGTVPTHFIAERKSGQKAYYGYDGDGRYKIPGTSSIHGWKLTRLEDRNGNYYQVSYSTDGRPLTINYTLNSNSGLSANQEVRFVYESRADARTRYRFGKPVVMDDRLKRIEAWRSGTIVRQYKFAYGISGITQKSRLHSVTECGIGGACMPPVAIQWQTDSVGYSYAAKNLPISTIQYYDYTKNTGTSVRYSARKELITADWVDINGDGRVDLVRSYIGPGGGHNRHVRLKLADGSWSSNQSQWYLPRPLRNYNNAVTNMSTGRFQAGVVEQGQYVDVNGDGLVDVVYAYKYDKHFRQYHVASDIEAVKETWLNTGNGWKKSTAYAPKDYANDYTLTGGEYVGRLRTKGRFVDINGDGLVDWISSMRHRRAGWHDVKKTWINTGSGWRYDATYAPPSFLVEYYGSHQWGRSELVDVNGDGLLDWIEAYYSYWDGTQLKAWINTGTKFVRNDAYKLPEAVYIYDGQGGPSVKTGRFVDINGDGLRDWVRSARPAATHYFPQDTATRLNKGKGWVTSAAYKPPYRHQDYRYTSHKGSSGKETVAATWPVQNLGVYMDVNQDGLMDFIQSYKDVYGTNHRTAWINNGNGFDVKNNYVPGGIMFNYSGRDRPKTREGGYVDIDANGAVDWVRSAVNTTHGVYTAKVSRPDEIKKITTTMGVEVVPEYLPLTNSDVAMFMSVGSVETIIDNTIWTLIQSLNTAEPDSRYVTGPLYVTSALKVSSADGSGYNATEYRYAGAQSHRKGRGFLGFAQRNVYDSARDIGSYESYRQDYPFTGRIKQRITAVGDQTISEEYVDYSERNLTHANGNTTRMVYSPASASVSAELDGTLYKATRNSQTYDIYGNVKTAHSEVGLPADAIDGTDAISWARLDRSTDATNVYQHDLANWLIAGNANTITSTVTASKPGKPSITNSSEARFDSKGRLTTAIQEPDATDSTKVTASYSYDAYGNITTETTTALNHAGVLESRTDTIGYDAEFLNAASLTNALNQVASITYDSTDSALCNRPEKVIDINAQSTTYKYDGFCRTQSERTATGAASEIEATTEFITSNLDCSNCQTAPKLQIRSSITGESPVSRYLNLFGQTMLSTTQGMLLETIEQRSEVDYLGRTTRTTQPYFVGDTPIWTGYSYDDIGRVVTTTLPFSDASGVAATVDNGYFVDQATGLMSRTGTNTLGHTTQSFSNAVGELKYIRDAHNEDLNYDYDARGSLIQTTDAQHNQIHVEYDAIGRRTRLDDPDLGVSTYSYSGFGEMLTQTDNKGQVMAMRYDILGRLTERDVENDTGGIDTSRWQYDTAANGKGALAEVFGPNGYHRQLSYDAYSRFVGETATIKGKTFTQTLGYNDLGQLSQRTYPESGAGNAFGVQYQYTNGYLSSMTSLADANGNCIEHWRADKYDALGRTQEETLGKILTTNRSFKPGQGVLNRLTTVLNVSNNASTVQDLEYQYDANNNLKTFDDHQLGSNESYQYDALDRLTLHEKVGQDPVEVRYDAIGNITYKSDVGNYHYNPSTQVIIQYPEATIIRGKPHAVVRVDSLPGTADPLAKFQINWNFAGEEKQKELPSIHDQDFEYDDNGNITISGSRRVYWTAFDKPHTITNEQADGTHIGSKIEYGADFERIYKAEATFTALGNLNAIKESTIYVGKDYEEITDKDGNTKHRYTIAAGGHSIQIERADGSDKDEVQYLLGDNLGSTNVIVNAAGDIEQRLAFDPWGMRTNTGDPTAVNAITNKGYTGHEMDDETGLINMNARMYDPYLGRFLSADPVLQDAMDMQSFNRYSYVRNNPLKYTDPTGYCSSLAGGVSQQTGCIGGSSSIGGVIGGGIGGDDYGQPWILVGLGNFFRYDFSSWDLSGLNEFLADFLPIEDNGETEENWQDGQDPNITEEVIVNPNSPPKETSSVNTNLGTLHIHLDVAVPHLSATELNLLVAFENLANAVAANVADDILTNIEEVRELFQQLGQDKQELDPDTEICNDTCLAVVGSGGGGLGPFSGEGSTMSLVDFAAKSIHNFRTIAGGVGRGFGGALTIEVGRVGSTTIGAMTGWAVAGGGFAAVINGVSASVFIPADGSTFGMTMGYAVGVGWSAWIGGSYTFYDGSVNWLVPRKKM